ncbi:hypothetical protein LWI28_016446 [Acer negundo]|uniref:RNase H type-1 domain-containing protein n=1 Tax=Acer negundo TaxID=4023 RepID=A0AAD5ILY0_ACENE|nr:hypothetical protein LWI28_016446 [Acer negundo]
MSFLELITSYSGNSLLADLELICIFFQRVWWLRNQMIHNASGKNDLDVIGWSRNFLKGFRAANTLPMTGNVNNLVTIVKWNKPDRGCLKANTDAAMNKNDCCIRTGCIIRDSRGVVRRSFIQKFPFNFSPQAAKALALLCGIRGAMDAGDGNEIFTTLMHSPPKGMVVLSS